MTTIRSFICGQVQELVPASLAVSNHSTMTAPVALHRNKWFVVRDQICSLACAVASVTRGYEILWRVVSTIVVKVINGKGTPARGHSYSPLNQFITPMAFVFARTNPFIEKKAMLKNISILVRERMVGHFHVSISTHTQIIPQGAH